MSRTVVVDEAAVEEAEAQARYDSERAGEDVALRFAAGALSASTILGLRSPLPLKRVFLDRFPFAVVFYVEGDRVYVVALEALRKKPGYWRSRLPP
jgi:hypothetical protein